MDSHSPLLTANGHRAPIMTNWEAPEKTPYFGWVTPHGPLAIAMSSISACVPSVTDKGASGDYVILLNFAGSPQIPLPAADAVRLLRRMGWVERSAIERV